MNVWQVLEAAADKIERDGWQKFLRHAEHTYTQGPHCALGGIDAVTGNHWMAEGRQLALAEAAYLELAKALPKHTYGADWAIADWNNADDRTADEVIAMLRAVAATEKARAARLLPVVCETA